jgi:hypothetical protein
MNMNSPSLYTPETDFNNDHDEGVCSYASPWIVPSRDGRIDEVLLDDALQRLEDERCARIELEADVCVSQEIAHAALDMVAQLTRTNTYLQAQNIALKDELKALREQVTA